MNGDSQVRKSGSPEVRKSFARSRRGIALILAIVVLAGLLLLGLPFLMSQSSALAGIRSFRSAEQAANAADSAMRIGIAVAATATEDLLRPATKPDDPTVNAFSQLAIRQSTYVEPKDPNEKPQDIESGWLPPFTLQADELNQANIIYSVRLDRLLPKAFGRIPLSEPVTGAPPHHQLVSIALEDESGKLDPNTMSPAAWDVLIKKVLGPNADWDDNDVLHSHVDRTELPNGTIQYTRIDDPDHFGQLATALAELPHSPKIPLHRITDLDSLLLADPGHNQIATPDYLYGTATPPPGLFGFRRRLTRSELERLRPFLTLHQAPIGREGLIDFGTVVADPDPASGNNRVIWDAPFGSDFPAGLGMLLYQKPPMGDAKVGWITSFGNSGDLDLTTPGGSPVKDTALAIRAQTPVNLHAASATVRAVLTGKFDGRLNGNADRLIDLRSISGIAPVVYNTNTAPPAAGSLLTAWHLQDPLRLSFDMGNGSPRICLPPVGIAGSGIYTLSAAAAVTDGTGRQEAGSQRRQIVQALPHEHLLERRWTNQSEMQSLVAQHYSSNIVTWPHPVNRVLSTDASATRAWPATVPVAATAPLNEQHGFRPQVLPSWASWLDSRGHLVPWVDWAMAFGADRPLRDSSNVLNGGTTINTGTGNAGGAAQAVTTKPYDLDDLLPDGLRMKGGTGDDGRRIRVPGNGLLTLRSGTQEIDGRHFGLWIRPESNWQSANSPIVLVEARVGADQTVRPIKHGQDGRVEVRGLGDDTPAALSFAQEGQNLLGLYFDAKRQLMALVIAPPSTPHIDALGPWIGWDDPLTTDLDERCLGFGYGANASLGDSKGAFGFAGNGVLTALAPQRLVPKAPASGDIPFWGPNRIVTLYSTRTKNGEPYFKMDRWYRVEVVISSSRPGGSAILVDQIAGRNALLNTEDGSVVVRTFGDHCTLPALPLKVAPDAVRDPDTIEALPLKLSLPNEVIDIPAAALFPPHGMIRIGNEYLRYQKLVGNVFTTCLGGQRQQTNTHTPERDPQHMPTIEDHQPGTLIVPGDYRIPGTQAGSGRLYRGGCMLADGLPNGDLDQDSELFGSVWGALPGEAMPGVTVASWENGIVGGVPSTMRLTLSSTNAIPLMRGVGVPEQFPPTGIITVDNVKNFVYGEVDADSDPNYILLKGISQLPSSSNPPGPWQFPREVNQDGQYVGSLTRSNWGDFDYPILTGNRQIPSQRKVRLISLRLANGVDATETGRYSQVPFSDTRDVQGKPLFKNMVQLQHPRSGRIEWLEYRYIVKLPAVNLPDGGTREAACYLVADDTGWILKDFAGGIAESRRARMRTDHPGRGLLDNGAMATTWLAIDDQGFPGITPTNPEGTPVIPVQTALGNIGHLIATGDVVTIMPKGDRGSSGTKAYQAVVRYAATDGYRDGQGTDLLSNTQNEYFAFAHHLPDDAPSELSQFDILCGTCWTTPVDLSPESGLTGLDGFHLPRLDGFSGGVLIGGSHGAGLVAPDATVDALNAGTVVSNHMTTGTVTHWLDADNPDMENSLTLTEDDFDKAMLIQCAGSVPSSGPMGLISVGGEVFAYQTIGVAGQLRIIARGLLGSARVAHRGGEPFLLLPHGPIAMLDGSVTEAQFRFVNEPFKPTVSGASPKPYDGNTLPVPAPAVLICEPNGGKSEVLLVYGGQSRRTPEKDLVARTDLPEGTVPDKNNARHWWNYTQTSYSVAEWTRGLYNTTPQSWSGSGDGLRPIVIGWWPRYPSALPHRKLSDTQVEAAMLRSRAYAWVGFPHGFRNSWFQPPDPNNPKLTGLSFASIFQPAGPPVPSGMPSLFTVEVRALSTGLNWTESSLRTWNYNDTAAQYELSKEPFFNTNANKRFRFDHAVDGLELRVHWRYATAPAPANQAADPVAAMLNIAESANSSPALGAVSLRCFAPSQVLATEPAR